LEDDDQESSAERLNRQPKQTFAQQRVPEKRQEHELLLHLGAVQSKVIRLFQWGVFDRPRIFVRSHTLAERETNSLVQNKMVALLREVDPLFKEQGKLRGLSSTEFNRDIFFFFFTHLSPSFAKDNAHRDQR
jgi:hypothetical protein